MKEKKSTHLVMQPNNMVEYKNVPFYDGKRDQESSKSVFSFERNLLKDNTINEIVVKHGNK